MPGGNIFHRDLQWPSAEYEDEVGAWGAQTAHPRLLLCGAGARRGGGVSAIAGHNAAMAILRRATAERAHGLRPIRSAQSRGPCRVTTIGPGAPGGPLIASMR
jgi:hypothetical protein